MKMERKKLAIMPALDDCGGDIQKKWFVYYSYFDQGTGKMKRFKDYKSLHKAKTPKERYAIANRKIDEISEKLKSGWNPFNGKENILYVDELQRVDQRSIFGDKQANFKSFTHYSSYFITEKRKISRSETIKSYRSKLRRFGEWLTAQNIQDNMNNITTDIILKFFDYLIVTRKLSQSTVKDYKQLLTAVFDLAIDAGDIINNPVDPSIKGGHRIDYAAQPIAPDDLKLLMKTLESDTQLYIAALLEYFCFMRPGKEIRLMKVSWINFGLGMITVPDELSKSGRQKILTMPNYLQEVLRKNNIHTYNQDLFVLGKNGKPGPEPWGKNHFSEKFRRIRIKLNLPLGYKLYSFKHTGNAVAFAAGIPSSILMNQNGHSSLEITSIYLKNTAKVASPELMNNFPAPDK